MLANYCSPLGEAEGEGEALAPPPVSPDELFFAPELFLLELVLCDEPLW